MAPKDVGAIVQDGRLAMIDLVDVQERVNVIGRFAELLSACRDDLVKALIVTIGKPVAQARVEVDDAISVAQAFGALVPQAFGELRLREEAGRRGVLLLEPKGVAAAFVPWNYPVVECVLKICSGISAGCPVVVKVSPRAVGPICDVVQIARKATRLATAVQAVLGDVEVGEALVDATEVVAFTGSTAVGREIAERAGKHLHASILELGGKCPQIILDRDAIKEQGNQIVAAALDNAGQNCQSPARLLVQSKDVDFLRERIADCIAAAWSPSDPYSEDAAIGPVVDKAHAQHVRGVIESAEGASGWVRRAPSGREGSCYVEPCVVSMPAGSDWKWHRDEIFGPVITVEGYADTADAIHRASDSGYGLAAVVRSSDPEAGERVARLLDVGVVWINGSGYTPWSWPLQARRKSGDGVQLGDAGMLAYSNYKQIWNFS
jgi:acyl-CoA reductase-like NAD-dependent aldehyde dehydrogenase